MKKTFLYSLTVACALLSSNAQAADNYTLTIKNHVFTPSNLDIPAGKKVKIAVINQDATPEEFESHQLKREKIIQGNSTGYVLVGPLKAGVYKFVGEFNEDTAKGTITAK